MKHYRLAYAGPSMPRLHMQPAHERMIMPYILPIILRCTIELCGFPRSGTEFSTGNRVKIGRFMPENLTACTRCQPQYQHGRRQRLSNPPQAIRTGHRRGQLPAPEHPQTRPARQRCERLCQGLARAAGRLAQQGGSQTTGQPASHA